MFIEKLASFAQEPQRAFTGAEIFLPGVGKGKPSLTPAHKQQIQMFFESGQGPAYRGSRELEMAAAALNVPASAAATNILMPSRSVVLRMCKLAVR